MRVVGLQLPSQIVHAVDTVHTHRQTEDSSLPMPDRRPVKVFEVAPRQGRTRSHAILRSLQYHIEASPAERDEPDRIGREAGRPVRTV